MFGKRRFTQKIGDLELSEKAFDALLAKQSCAGVYARAFRMVRDVIRLNELNDQQKQPCEMAFSFLEKYQNLTKKDRSVCFYCCVYGGCGRRANL